MNQDNLEAGIRKYTKFWLKKNYPNLNRASFLVKVKKIDSLDGWQPGFLDQQIQKPWVNGGSVDWNNGNCQVTLQNIEAI